MDEVNHVVIACAIAPRRWMYRCSAGAREPSFQPAASQGSCSLQTASDARAGCSKVWEIAGVLGRRSDWCSLKRARTREAQLFKAFFKLYKVLGRTNAACKPDAVVLGGCMFHRQFRKRPLFAGRAMWGRGSSTHGRVVRNSMPLALACRSNRLITNKIERYLCRASMSTDGGVSAAQVWQVEAMQALPTPINCVAYLPLSWGPVRP